VPATGEIEPWVPDPRGLPSSGRAPIILIVILDVHGRSAGAYEREDPETGAPLPSGVDGYRLGGRTRGRPRPW
jgi:hypothetical protein